MREHLAQKGKASTLKNHTKKAHLSHVNHLPILMLDALFCPYMMLKLQINVLMPPQRLLTQDCGFIFRKEALQSQIAVSYNVCLNFCPNIMKLDLFVLISVMPTCYVSSVLYLQQHGIILYILFS